MSKSFKKGYLKSIKTKEEFEKFFKDAMMDDLNVSVAKSVMMVAFKKGFILEEAIKYGWYGNKA